MTLEDWLASVSTSELHFHLCGLSARKLHLLTAAFLRRVWDELPTEHTRTAVAATEKFADGRITACELARLRSTDLLESCEGLWLGPDEYVCEEQLIGMGWDCPCCVRAAAEYECRVVARGEALLGVRAAVDDSVWAAVRSALYAREVVVWGAARDEGKSAEEAETRAQYELVREITGPDGPNPRWPEWRTTDVRALARGIHRDQAFDRLPIFADALQDAGCDDDTVLHHCCSSGGHVRGCWVVDLAMGIG